MFTRDVARREFCLYGTAHIDVAELSDVASGARYYALGWCCSSFFDLLWENVDGDLKSSHCFKESVRFEWTLF